jgi:hypothetical protein
MQAAINLEANRIELFTKITKDNWVEAVFWHLANREAQHMQVIKRTNWRKRVLKDWYNLGIKGRGHLFNPGDLVILYDGKSAKKKMHLAYRGPFIVVSLGGFHSKSYYLRQVNSTAVPKSFHRDHLKPFKLRTGHLVTSYKQQLLTYQKLRARKAKHKLPKSIRKGAKA